MDSFDTIIGVILIETATSVFLMRATRSIGISIGRLSSFSGTTPTGWNLQLYQPAADSLPSAAIR